jgi:hypothetical protein
MAEPDNETIYVVDSSGWISIEKHPAQNRILYSLIELIEKGRIASPPEVWDELIRCHEVLAWIGDHRGKIVRAPLQVGYFTLIGQVAHQFPAMCATRGSKEKADGYVVALAAHGNQTSNPTKWAVVAAETLATKPNRKIPTACSAFNVECIGLIEMLRREFPDDDW